jgi:hypothetical protein
MAKQVFKLTFSQPSTNYLVKDFDGRDIFINYDGSQPSIYYLVTDSIYYPIIPVLPQNNPTWELQSSPTGLTYFESCCGDVSFKASGDYTSANLFFKVNYAVAFNNNTKYEFSDFCVSKINSPTGYEIEISLSRVTNLGGDFTCLSQTCNTCITYFQLCCPESCQDCENCLEECYIGVKTDGSFTPNSYYRAILNNKSVCLINIEPQLDYYKIPIVENIEFDINNYKDCNCGIDELICTTTTKYIPPLVNECGVLTVFNLNVSCTGTNPTSPSSQDGQVTLSINGGTPPYTIYWINNNTNTTINNNSINLTNLSDGSYTAVVTDYYGDYTSTTTCDLIIPTTTTTTTSPCLESNMSGYSFSDTVCPVVPD